MDGIGEGLINLVSTIGTPELYLLVAFLAAAETMFMMDLVVPGEVGMALAGLAAAETPASLLLVIAAAVLGAWIGDAISFAVGRRVARPVLDRFRWLRRRTETNLARATYYFAEHGGRAVVIGRFVGFLRAVVPVAAGMAGMTWKRFAGWNAVASVAWATTVVSLGYFLGRPFAMALDSPMGILVAVLAISSIVTCWRIARRKADRRRARLSAQVAAPGADAGIPA